MADYRVSVIIPVYNAGPYISKAVDSAIRHEVVGEVVLVEDGSTDNSLSICKELEKKHKKVKLFCHEKSGNYGAGASRNLGLSKAVYPYVAFLDADDYYLKNRFAFDQKVFSEFPAVDGVYNAISVHYYSLKGKKRFKKFLNSELTMVKREVPPVLLFRGLSSMINTIGHFHLDGLTFKKEVLQKMSYWFNPELRLHQDTEFTIRLAFYAKLFGGPIDKAVAVRGVHDDNRILNVQKNKQKSYYNRYLLFKSLYEWAQYENIDKIYVDHFNRMMITRRLTTLPYFMAWRCFISMVLKDKKCFLYNSYYNSVHYFLFGKNYFSKALLKLKVLIQSSLRIPSSF